MIFAFFILFNRGNFKQLYQHLPYILYSLSRQYNLHKNHTLKLKRMLILEVFFLILDVANFFSFFTHATIFCIRQSYLSHNIKCRQLCQLEFNL